ncbi:MAG: hypothetical protein LLF76_14835 [Planctomycetaceae bacterium]|nr:hypothetical protein [Planctomycetaceae bacterium]
MRIYRTFSIAAVVSTIVIGACFIGSVLKPDEVTAQNLVTCTPVVNTQPAKTDDPIAPAVSFDSLLSKMESESAALPAGFAESGTVARGQVAAYARDTADISEVSSRPSVQSTYPAAPAQASTSVAVASSSGGGSSGSTTPTSTPDSNNDVTRPVAGGGASPMLSKESLLTELRKLPPLPKVHYSWPLVPIFLSNEREIAYEAARITHALSLSGENVTEVAVDKFVAICAEVNKTNPAIPCFLGVNYSPWHWKFRPELGLGKAIPKEYNSNVFADPTYNDEIEQFALRMTLVKKWVEQSNQKYGANVKVGAILLDCERFERRLNDPSWNKAMGVAQNDIHVKAVEIFPGARIEWYDRGRRQGASEDYFNFTCYLADNAIMTGMSCSLYSPPDRTRMQKLFQATCDLADTYVINGMTPWKGLDVTPWVSLAWGYDWDLYRSDLNPGVPQPECYRSDWDYDLKYSRETGAELNSFTPPYDRAKVIIFFPQLFYKFGAPWYDLDSPWGKHFIEYCKGAAQTL